MDTNQTTDITTTTNTPMYTALQEAKHELGVWYAYDSKSTVIPEISGTREVKVTYKYKEGSKRTHDNVYVLVPTAHITADILRDNWERIQDYVVAYFQEWEDKAIKQAHRNNESRIYCDYLSLDKVIDAMETAEVGGRLNSEKIQAWFKEKIEDILFLTIAEKLGISEVPTEAEQAKITQYLQAYCKKFESLASPKTLLIDSDKEALKNVIRIADADSEGLGARFIAKIDEMKEKENEALLAL